MLFSVTIGDEQIYARSVTQLLRFVAGCRLSDEIKSDDIEICAGFCADRRGNVYESNAARARGEYESVGVLL